MVMSAKQSGRFFILSALILSANIQGTMAADSLSLYTPYTEVSVPPGETVTYSLDVINDGHKIATTGIAVSGLPRGWVHELKIGSWNIRQVSVLPVKSQTLALKVTVPVKVNKGNYHFRVVAGKNYVLPLVINVSERGTYKTVFTCDQANMQGNASSKFNFKTALRNETGDKQLYSLRSDVPRGWTVTFKPTYQQATSVEIEPNASKNITVEVDPPDNIQEGTYKIPVAAVTNSTSASLELEAVVTGSYEMELTTPTGLLSTNITAGDERRLELAVRNTGTSALADIKFSASKPANWDVQFDPKEIDKIEAGENGTVFATIKADKKAIAGDYGLTLTAKTPEVSSNASFRVAVKTPMLWGWIGAAVILIALFIVFRLFRKYGRR